MLSLKNSFKGGAFIGCSNYPECNFTRPLSKKKVDSQNNTPKHKLIGQNEFGKDIYLKNWYFGWKSWKEKTKKKKERR